MSTYGKSEIVAFATGMAQHTGVTVDWRDGLPRTDGKTVWIDCSPCNGEGEYLLRTGHADHEIAHVWFESVDKTQGWAAEIAKAHNADQYAWAAHECLNVTLDIHDETRMVCLLPNVAPAFNAGNAGAARRLYNSSGNQPLWRLRLLAGILRARLNDRYTRRLVRDYFGRRCSIAGNPVLQACMDSRERSAKGSHRTAAQWARIRAHATTLFVNTLPYLKPEDQLPEPKPMPSAGQPPGVAPSQTIPGPGPAQSNDAAGRLRETGVAEQKGLYSPDPFDDQPYGQSGGASGGSCGAHSTTATDMVFHQRCNSVLGSVMDEIMQTEDSMRMNHYRSTGASLGRRWSNLLTTGNVFVTKDRAVNQELNLALLLDRSGSMSGRIAMCAAACASLAQCAESAGADVNVWMFSASTVRIPWPTLLAGVEIEGPTRGAEALEQSVHWLLSKPTGRKLCVCVTDGEWGDRGCAVDAMLRGARCGVEFVWIGLGMTHGAISDGWPPGLRTACCQDDPAQLADQLRKAVYHR